MGKKSKLNSTNADSFPFMKLFIVPRPIRKWLVCQIIVVSVILFLWIHFNNGLLPKFLRSDTTSLSEDPSHNILLYYPESNNDASRITWARAVNSRPILEQTLKSSIHIIEADVSVRHEGQKVLPIMADSPQASNYINLNEWIEAVIKSEKCMKLDFHSTGSVEVSMKDLNPKLSSVKRPVWLHANVLRGPHSQDDPVNPKVFLEAIQKYLPGSVISLGWTTGHHTDVSQSGYSWSAVMDMYDVVKEFDLQSRGLLTFSVRLSLLHNSVLQLKWLIDVTGGSLTVIHDQEDKPSKENLMYASFKFAPDRIFFDLDHKYLGEQLTKYRHYSQEHVDTLVHKREALAFRPKAWLKIGFHEYLEAILASEDAMVLLTPDVHLLTKAAYEPSDKLRLYGRVMFLNRLNVPAKDSSGLEIYFRTDQVSHPDYLIGLKVFIGVLGQIRVESVGIGEQKVSHKAAVTPSGSFCYRFAIVNKDREMIVHVGALPECDTLATYAAFNHDRIELSVPLPRHMPMKKRPIAIKVPDNTRAAVIDQLIVEYGANGIFDHPV